MKNKKIKIICFQILILLVFYSNLISQDFVEEKKGFNIIETNDLKITDYSFAEFMDDYSIDCTFVCIHASMSLGTDYHDQYSITDMKSSLEKYCRLEKFLGINEMGERIYDAESVIELNSKNFSEFRQKFITGNCLQFQNGFPVKFIKIKSVHKAGDMVFNYMPEGELAIENAPKDNIIYYAYKKAKIGDKEYVYLGIKNHFSTERKTHVKKTFLGWTLYKEKGTIHNLKLWKNIGLRPKNSILHEHDINRLPLVFLPQKKIAIQNYFETGNEPTTTDLIVGKVRINKYLNILDNSEGRYFRWLPLYNEKKNAMNTLTVAVPVDSLFQEGNVLCKDTHGNSLFNVEVLLEQEKIVRLKRQIAWFFKTPDDIEFKRMLRSILAILFEIDYAEVNQKKLEETKLSDLWERIIGDKKITKKVCPELSKKDNVTLDTIQKNWQKFKPEIISNASEIINYLNYILSNEWGLYTNCISYEDDGVKIILDSYWLEVNKLRLFKGITFKHQ